MNLQNDAGGKVPSKEKDLNVQVRYVAARRPFVDRVDPLVTLKDFKPTVLAFFELVEGNVDGGTKVYNFILNGIVQTDLDVTLGALAVGEHELKLDFVEQLIQG